MYLSLLCFILSVVLFAIGSTIGDFKIKNNIKDQAIKEAMDYQELKDHQDKLARECLNLRYQIDVIVQKDKP